MTLAGTIARSRPLSVIPAVGCLLSLTQGLSRGLASLAGAGQLHKHVARLCALVLIIEALHPVDAEASSAQLPADLQLARQLHQCAMVCLDRLQPQSALRMQT